MSRKQPKRYEFPEGDSAGALVRGVRDALTALPAWFQTTTRAEGLEVGDLFGLNTVLGGAIEVQVVESLNRIRSIWDPVGRWSRYRFERSSQTFPDVRLVTRKSDGTLDIILGIELKGWYLFAKEGEPSFRYTVTPSACGKQDLLAVVPWHLKNVLSGEPVVGEPYIEQARYAAEYRNWWWTNVRETGDLPEQRRVTPPDGEAQPYPAPKTRISDRAIKDGGSNFGRVARIHGLMDDYIELMRARRVAGIPVEHWILFFKLHAEAKNPEAITRRLAQDLTRRGLDEEAAFDVVEAISRIVERLR